MCKVLTVSASLSALTAAVFQILLFRFKGKKSESSSTVEYPISFKLPDCLTSGWTICDCFLVVSSVVFMWLIWAVQATSGIGEAFSPTTIRSIRLLRIVRALRVLHQFDTLYLLIQGLLNSATTILSIFCIICFFIYIFGLICIEFISVPALKEPDKYDPVYLEFIDDFFST